MENETEAVESNSNGYHQRTTYNNYVIDVSFTNPFPSYFLCRQLCHSAYFPRFRSFVPLLYIKIDPENKDFFFLNTLEGKHKSSFSYFYVPQVYICL